MLPIEYRSTDAGAPGMAGQPGSLISVLDFVLVGTGGVAYGSGVTAKAAAGWSKVFSGANVAVYRNNLASGGSGCYVRIDDTNALFARVVVYRAMSDIHTGVDPTPSPGQIAGGEYWHKSDTASSAARRWRIAADDRTIYLNINASADSSVFAGNYLDVYYAGDYATWVPGGFGYGCQGRPAALGSQLSPAWTSNLGLTSGTMPFANFTIMKGASAVSCGVPAMGRPSGSAGAIAYPDSGTGQVVLIPALCNTQASIAGRLRGAYVTPNGPDTSGMMASVSGLLEEPSAVCMQFASYYNAGGTYSAIWLSKGTW